MLNIYSFDTFVSIPCRQTEFSIYTTHYYTDENGTVLPDNTDRLDIYEKGDLIIETPSVKYIWKKIYMPYQYCEDIFKSIAAQKESPIISVDLNEISGGYFDYKGFEVITK